MRGAQLATGGSHNAALGVWFKGEPEGYHQFSGFLKKIEHLGVSLLSIAGLKLFPEQNCLAETSILGFRSREGGYTVSQEVVGIHVFLSRIAEC